jgi:hypothetical protein
MIFDAVDIFPCVFSNSVFDDDNVAVDRSILTHTGIHTNDMFICICMNATYLVFQAIHSISEFAVQASLTFAALLL